MTGQELAGPKLRWLGNRSVVEGAGIGLSCHHCGVGWGGCAAECCCPECGAAKGYHEDDWGTCYCEQCRRLRPAPCPFEHEVERGVSTEIDDEEWNIATVICGDCGTRGPYVDLDDYPHHGAAEAAAVRLWNTRTPEAADKLEALSGRVSTAMQALALARNRLRAAAVNRAPTGGREYYEYSQWADEADASIARLQTQTEGGNDDR